MIFRLALRSLWCDIKHSCRGIEVVGLFAYVCSFLGALFGSPSSIFLELWGVELGIRRLMPVCEKAYFVLPVSGKDRARLMRCRTELVELGLLLLWGIFVLVYQLFFRKSFGSMTVWRFEAILLPLMLLETFFAVYFCSYYPEAGLTEKAVSVFLGILGWLTFVVGIFLGDTESCCMVSIFLCVFSLIDVFSLKLYFMLHAHYEEYRYVNLMYENSRKEKEKERQW